jgi:hypothetical protein
MIERQNILDLIGKNKGKYSSCIITSYTFDFTFFEERIMSVLRTSNIKNVNVFLDGKYLEQHLESSNGNEFKTHKTYSLNPIYETGVFHPKIMLLTGQKHGLLIIGSGNLTSSGLSTNDEIWGAFHLNSIESTNAPLFASVWNYLEQYLLQAKGFNAQKIGWITQRSPWLNEIRSFASEGFMPINKDFEIQFIGNSSSITSYQELVKALPKKVINKLTIVSPYFDEGGKVLEQLTTDLNIKETVCISDSEFGLLPIKLNDLLCNTIKFFDWKDCLEDFDKRFNRLHAKIFNFEFEDGWEYLLIGSANATINALGSNSAKYKNGEAGILLKRKLNKGYINDLGINYKKAKPIDVRSFIRKPNNMGDNIPSVKFENRIIYSEINGNKLLVFLKDTTVENQQIIILDSENNQLEMQIAGCVSRELKFSLNNPNEAYKIYLAESDKRITNYTLIHNVAYQSKCNPDPNHAEIGQIIESLSVDPENGQFIELLGYADYNWVDEELDGSLKKASKIGSSKDQKESHKIYDALTTDEFNQLNTVQSNESDLLNNSSVQIADFLNILSRGLIQSNSSIKESNEEALSNQNEDEQTGSGGEVRQSVSVNNRGELEEKVILKHLDKVCSFYTSQLSKLTNSKSFKSVPNRPLTIKDLSNMSIALDLMFIYYGKKYTLHKTEFVISFKKELSDKIRSIESKYKLKRIEKSNRDYKTWVYYEVESDWFNEVKKHFNKLDPKLWVEQPEYKLNLYQKEYLPIGAYNSDEGYGLKHYLIEMLGSFLLNANSTANYKIYDYDVLNEKVLSLRKSIFEHATFLCLNINWKEQENKYRDILLLDLLHFVYPKTITVHEIDLIEKSLVSIYDKSKYKHPGYFNNYQYATEKLYPNYLRCKDVFKKEPSDSTRVVKSSVLNYLYSKEMGFGLLRNSGKDYLGLEKPGLVWDYDIDAAVLKITYPESQVKYYND